MSSKAALIPSQVYVRIRPVTEKGDCGHTDGEAGNKTLDGWTEDTVTVQENDLRQKTAFKVTAVVPPEVEQ